MFFYETDPDTSFAGKSYPAEYCCWLITDGHSDLVQQADGSWVGTVCCYPIG